MQSRLSTVRFGRAATPTTKRRPLSVPRLKSSSISEQRWSRLSWPLSVALFVVPVVLLVATVFAPRFAGTPQVLVRVTDRFSGQQIAGADVVAGEQSFVTGPDGTAPIELLAEHVPLTIAAPGYESVTTTLSRDGPEDWLVALRPSLLRGTVTDANSAEGIADADVTVIAPDGGEQVTATDELGQYAFEGVPEGAEIRISSLDHGVFTEAVGQRTSIDVVMKPSVVTGLVTDTAGSPISGARVAASNGSASGLSGPDGLFRLTGGTDVSEVVVSAPGFADMVVPVGESRQVAAALYAEMIRAIYANLGVLSDPVRWNRLIEIADTTEINAIVVDVKQDTIYYDTQVPFFRNIDGMITPLFDVPELLAELEANGIYSIARMVVFKDPIVAEMRPDLAVRDEVTGDLWRDMNGTGWVNAFNQELWQANAELGAELARLGFDEIQYDYIRFPSDGDLRTADFGVEYSEANRRAAITGAVALGGEQIRAAGAKFAIDLFPIIALMGDDQGIGQTVQDLTPLADYVCLMIYPSHYERGNIPVDGHPNDFPAETVAYTLEKTEELIPGTKAKMRPWLQDFTYPLEGYAIYGPAEVRAQIDAAEAQGVSGWLLWNAAGEFEVSALAPE